MSAASSANAALAPCCSTAKSSNLVFISPCKPMAARSRPSKGLAKDGELSPIQEAFVKNYAFQCGYCTPGMVMTSHALLQRNPNPSEEEIRKALAGNLCMCTGYVQIVEAVKGRGKRNEEWLSSSAAARAAKKVRAMSPAAVFIPMISNCPACSRR